MDLVEARSDGNEQLLASGLTPGEVDEVLDWWRYTKPFGPNVKIVVRDAFRQCLWREHHRDRGERPPCCSTSLSARNHAVGQICFNCITSGVSESPSSTITFLELRGRKTLTTRSTFDTST